MKESKRVLARAVARPLTFEECEQIAGSGGDTQAPTLCWYSGPNGSYDRIDDYATTDREE